MVNQVQVVAILMIVQGSLASLMGIVYVVMGPAMFAMMSLNPGGRPGQPRPAPPDEVITTIVSVVYVVMGFLVLTSGVLNLVGGIRSLSLRGRTLALVALFSNVLPLFTCYCLPTALGLMIYGLIVFFQADVARAFALVAAGESPERVRARLTRYRRYDEEDLGEEEGPPPGWRAPRGRRAGSEGFTEGFAEGFTPDP